MKSFLLQKHLCYKDYTSHNLCGMIQNKDIAVVKGDKDSSLVTIKKNQIM